MTPARPFAIRMLSCLILMAALAKAMAGPHSFDEDFVVVFIDAQSEAKFGAIPLDRNILANGINAIADAGARGLVLKFFLDQPKDGPGDKRLAKALARIPGALQARLDSQQGSSNQLDERFSLNGSFNVAATGSRGWIPLPLFAKHATDVGFIDFNSPLVPMVEQYQSRTVKSLILCAIEMAAKKKAILRAEHWIQVGEHIIKVDSRNQATAGLIQPPLARSVSFNSVLDGTTRAELKNKVVILAYDGPHIETLMTSAGPMGSHRYFVNILRAIYDGK